MNTECDFPKKTPSPSTGKKTQAISNITHPPENIVPAQVDVDRPMADYITITANSPNTPDYQTTPDNQTSPENLTTPDHRTASDFITPNNRSEDNEETRHYVANYTQNSRLSGCCGNTESAVDVISCLCCLKAIFYHCCQDWEEEHYEDNPCECCDHAHCPARWACIVACGLLLPCLLLYWPARGVVMLIRKCRGLRGRRTSRNV